MKRYTESVADRTDGHAVQNAQVTIWHPDGSAAVVYSDADGALVKAQPILTDVNGEFWFYAPDGAYDIRVVYGTSTHWVYSIQIYDVNPFVYDVTAERFGATGDGATDDTAAIQEAINAAEAAGGGKVYFPRGTYYVTSLTVDDTCDLEGDGPDATVIEFHCLGNTHGLSWTGTDRTGGILRNMRFHYRGAGQNAGYHGLYVTRKIHCYNLVIGDEVGHQYGFTNDNIHLTATPLPVPTEEPLFCIFESVKSYEAGRNGCSVYDDTNCAVFINCQFCWAAEHGFHVNWTPAGGLGVHALTVIGGQASANTMNGWYFQKFMGGHISGIYSEHNDNNYATGNYYNVKVGDAGDGPEQMFLQIAHFHAEYDQYNVLGSRYNNSSSPADMRSCQILLGGTPIEMLMLNLQSLSLGYDAGDNCYWHIHPYANEAGYDDCLQIAPSGASEAHIDLNCAGVGGVRIATRAGAGDPAAKWNGEVYFNDNEQLLKLRRSGAWQSIPSGNQSGAGAPAAVVPRYIGDIYIDTTPIPDNVYIAYGTAAGEWAGPV